MKKVLTASVVALIEDFAGAIVLNGHKSLHLDLVKLTPLVHSVAISIWTAISHPHIELKKRPSIGGNRVTVDGFSGNENIRIKTV